TAAQQRLNVIQILFAPSGKLAGSQIIKFKTPTSRAACLPATKRDETIGPTLRQRGQLGSDTIHEKAFSFRKAERGPSFFTSSITACGRFRRYKSNSCERRQTLGG